MKHNLLCFKLSFLSVALLIGLFVGPVVGLFVAPRIGFADSTQTVPRTTGQGSENYYKPQKDLLPGEEVVTPGGKKMKVWSTRGGVATQPLPTPGTDATATPESLPINGVIVDTRTNDRLERHRLPDGHHDKDNDGDKEGHRVEHRQPRHAAPSESPHRPDDERPDAE